MKLKPYRTLVHFDLPEVILCYDIFGTKHLCTRVIIDDDSEKDNYYSVSVTDARIKDLLEKHTDLRNCLLHPEKREWNIIEVNDAGELHIVRSSDSVSEELLPLSGFQMGNWDISEHNELVKLMKWLAKKDYLTDGWEDMYKEYLTNIA